MKRLALLVFAAALSLPAAARVSDDEAARLGRDLTPVGAERAGNRDGSIPAWEGGLTKPPAGYQGNGARYVDPFPEDRPLFTITAANLAQYRAQLTAGQVALFGKFPETYRMNVYRTRRTFANPQFIYDATLSNATRAELDGNGEALAGAITGVPFPIPKNGAEVIWNHRLRYRDIAVQRWNNQFAVTATGDYNAVKLREDMMFAYSQPGIQPRDLNNVALYFLQLATEPPRLAGTITLIHETLDQVREARKAWQYSPGQHRLRRAPNVAYDNPATAADGLRTHDQADMFNGAMDRYDWKLAGKRELYVPANAYAVHSSRLRYRDIVRKGHVNQDLARYELRRVWVVEASLRKGASHVYKRRSFYVDEDGWQIVAVDAYDARDELWRVQEAHTVVAYDKPYLLPVMETVYDLQGGRYLVQALNNEDPETLAKPFDAAYFEPGNVTKLSLR